jgi:hypothetical protein
MGSVVVMMMLGLSGCAGMQQRQKTSWISPEAESASGTEERPLARLAWWRRPKAEPEGLPASATDRADARRSSVLASNATSTAVASEDRPGLFRHFPMLGRRWNGTGRDNADANVRAAWKPDSPNSGTGSTAFAAPASASASASKRSTLAPPASVGEVAFNLSAKRPQVDPAAIPAGHAGTAATMDEESQAASSAPPATNSAAQLPTPANPTAVPSSLQDAPPPPNLPAPPSPPSPPAAAPTDSPPPPPSSPRRPTPPSPSVSADEGQPAAGTPSQPGAPSPTEQPAGNSSAWGPAPAPVPGFGQTGASTSAQGGFESPTFVEPAGQPCKARHGLCPLKKHHPLASAQFETTTGSCESASVVKVKKPCFLKTFLHKATCPGQTCGCAGGVGGCDSQPMLASPQGTSPSTQW